MVMLLVIQSMVVLMLKYGLPFQKINAELMDKRPDEGYFYKHNFNKDSSNKRVFFKKKKTKLTKRKENKIFYNHKEQNGEEVILLDQKDKQVEEIQLFMVNMV